MSNLKNYYLLVVILGLAGCNSKSDVSEVPAPGDSPSAAVRPASAAETELPVQLLSDAELSEGWLSLFDGVSLYGWQATSDANWQVTDGAITVDSGGKGLLCTTSPFSDYVLKLEFQAEPTTNSGVFLRTGLSPADVAVDCYELNIAPPDNPFPTGGLVARAKAPADLNRDGWQTFEIFVEGGRLRVVLDGTKVLDYQDPAPVRRGLIGLQLNEGKVAFRNIRIRPLGLKDLFNGTDLSGWKTYPEMASEFSVTSDGDLVVKNGPGQLETTEAYRNFVLQLQCKVNAPGLNSGIFFRCIPGQWMGYESQIHNGYTGGNRSKPKDWGTGAIFQRQKARLVNADDLVWFHKTLIADGPHIAVWVNGLQVSDWTDTRTPDPNPREGQRLEAGPIIIQGHDPTTDLSFRQMRISELPPRIVVVRSANRTP